MRLRCGFLGCRDVFSEPFFAALQQWGVLAAEGEPVDVGVIASHGKVLSAADLQRYPRGVINMHPSLLPLYRGAAPAEARACLFLLLPPSSHVFLPPQWQLLDGVSRSGITAVLTTPRVDAGPILAQEAFDIGSDTTRNALLREAATRGVSLLERLLCDWETAVASAWPQENGGSARRAPKVRREMSRFDWAAWGAGEAVRRQRALGERFGGLECRFGEKTVKLTGHIEAELDGADSGSPVAKPGQCEIAWREGVLRVRVRDGWLRVPRLAVAGAKAPMDAASFARGHLLRSPDARFTS